MPLPLAAGLLRLTLLYLLAGTLLLPWLYRSAWPAAATGARDASWGFRVAVLPGTLLLWPLLLLRARRPAVPSGEDPRGLRRAQSALILAAGVVVLVALTIARRTAPPRHTVETLPAMLTGSR